MVNARPNMFLSNSGSSLWNLSSSVSSGAGQEIDLRAEMDLILFGSSTSPRKGHPLVVREMRRNADGSKVPCECKLQFSDESDPDCSYCQGEGYLWDENWYIARAQYVGSDGGLGSRYRIFSPGEVRVDTKVFFFRYDTPIQYGDKIVEMKLDDEGNPVVPYIREAIYKPQTVNRLRSDHGRVEFIAAYCLENEAVRSDTLA